ncbi:MAG: O-antigen ligase family protein [Thermotogae bacterium]|nr:O-antigen ligase family protein [Thermotogota bacterium]
MSITVLLTRKGVAYLGTSLAFFVGYVFMYNFFKDSDSNKFTFVKALHTFGTIFSVLGITFLLMGLNYPQGSTPLQKIFGNVKFGDDIFISSLFHNENILGALLMFSIPATLTLYFINKDKGKMRKARYYLMPALLQVVVLWKSDGRAAWLATGISGAYIASAYARRKAGLIIFVTVTLVIALTISIERSSFELITVTRDPGMRGRLILWVEGIELVKRSPLVGVGLGETKDAIETLLHQPLKVQTMHNSYFRMAVELGIPGLVVYLWFLVAILREGLLKMRRVGYQSNERYLNFAMGLFIGNLIYQLFEAPMFGGFSFQSFFLLCIIAMVLSINGKRSSNGNAKESLLFCSR